MIEKFLGPPQFFQTEAERQDEVGVATGLAWTENGGEIMPVEVAILEGKGNLQITGQIGEIMQESAQAALTYIKSRALRLGIDPEVFERMDIHIHMPEGAIPKDGPSRGDHHGHRADLRVHRAAGLQGCRHDRRDHPARAGAADWRVCEKRSWLPTGPD